MHQDDISDEYINEFFERVQYKHAPSAIKWVRADDFGAMMRGTYGDIEVGWESVQDSRTDEPRDVGPLLLGSMRFTGDLATDAEQFLDLMVIWAAHEAAEQVRLDDELVIDPHDVDPNTHHYYGRELRDAYAAKWTPEEAMV